VSLLPVDKSEQISGADIASAPDALVNGAKRRGFDILRKQMNHEQKLTACE